MKNSEHWVKGTSWYSPDKAKIGTARTAQSGWRSEELVFGTQLFSIASRSALALHNLPYSLGTRSKAAMTWSWPVISIHCIDRVCQFRANANAYEKYDLPTLNTHGSSGRSYFRPHGFFCALLEYFVTTSSTTISSWLYNNPLTGIDGKQLLH